MTKREDYLAALSFWTLADEYICLVENVAQEIIKQGNPWVIVSNCIEGKEAFESAYHLQTKWSDHNIVTPLLFDLYHSFELLMKGFLIVHREGKVRAQHRLEQLCKRFEDLFPQEDKINCLLRKYTVLDLK